MKSELLNYLLLSADLAAVVGTRISWDVAPQGTPKPFVVLTSVSDIPDYDFDGEILGNNLRLQVDVYGQTLKQAQSIQKIFETIFSGKVFTTDGVTFEGGFIVSNRDLTEDEPTPGARVPRSSQDYQFIYSQEI